MMNRKYLLCPIIDGCGRPLAHRYLADRDNIQWTPPHIDQLIGPEIWPRQILESYLSLVQQKRPLIARNINEISLDDKAFTLVVTQVTDTKWVLGVATFCRRDPSPGIESDEQDNFLLYIIQSESFEDPGVKVTYESLRADTFKRTHHLLDNYSPNVKEQHIAVNIDPPTPDNAAISIMVVIEMITRTMDIHAKPKLDQKYMLGYKLQLIRSLIRQKALELVPQCILEDEFWVVLQNYYLKPQVV